MLPGSRAVFERFGVGRVGGTVCGQQALDRLPRFRSDLPIGDDLLNQRGDLAAGPLLQQDDGQRDLALAEIAADGFAEDLFVRRVIEHIVDDLERDAEVEAVFAQGDLLFRGTFTEHAADFSATGEEIGRLATDDLQMFLLGDGRIAHLGELVQLAFDHPERDFTQQTHDLKCVLRERHRHRPDVQVVAQQDRDVVAPP